MATTTTNFNFPIPQSTDLVKDGATAIAALGTSIDTDFVDLKGGTTGQILAKASNTDLDYTWIANDQGDLTAITAGTGISVTSPTGPIPTVAIDSTVATLTGTQTLTNKTLTSPALTTPTISTLTTNGDTIYGTGSGAIARLGIGTTGQVLTVASGVPSWATPAGGASFATGYNYVTTAEDTTSSSFTNLTTSQAVTLTTGTKALIILKAVMSNQASYANTGPTLGVTVSGASSVTASDEYSVGMNVYGPSSNFQMNARGTILLTGLTAGSNVFTMKFKDMNGFTSRFSNRSITVIDMGS